MSPLLLVANLNRSIDFYTTKLGFRQEFQYEDFYSGISKEGFSMHLKVGNSLTAQLHNKRENQDLDVIFSVEGIENLFKEFAEKSMEFVQLLRNMPYGKEFYVADPDGNLIGFVEEP